MEAQIGIVRGVTADRARGSLWAAALLMAALGTFHAWSVLVQPLQDELDASRSTVSAVYALATAVFAASMLLEPAAHRRFPAVVLGAGSALLAAAGLALAAIPSEAAVFVGYGVLFAVANGIGYGLAVHIAATVGRHRRDRRVHGRRLRRSAARSSRRCCPSPRATPASRPRSSASPRSMAVVAAVQVRGARPGRAAPPAARRRRGGVAGACSGRDRVFWLLWLGFLFGSAAGLVVIGHGAAIVSSLGGGAAALTLGASLAAGGQRRRAPRRRPPRRPRQRPRRADRRLGPRRRRRSSASPPAPGPRSPSPAWRSPGSRTAPSRSPTPSPRRATTAPHRTAGVYARVFTAWGVAGVTAPVAAGALYDRTGGYGTMLVILGAGSIARRGRERGAAAVLAPVRAARRVLEDPDLRVVADHEAEGAGLAVAAADRDVAARAARTPSARRGR